MRKTIEEISAELFTLSRIELMQYIIDNLERAEQNDKLELIAFATYQATDISPMEYAQSNIKS